MIRLLYCLFLASISSLASPTTLQPISCPDQILCETNRVTKCIAQGQFAQHWSNVKLAGSPIIKGAYSFNSVWVKYANGYAVADVCYYVDKSTATAHYVSVNNKGKPAYSVTLPLSNSWTTVPDQSGAIKCESSNIFQCPLLMIAPSVAEKPVSLHQ